MKISVKVFVVWVLFLVSQSSLSEAPRYPHVLDFHGKVTLQTKDNVLVKLEKKSLLRESALIETSQDSYIRLQWDEHRVVTLESKSKITVPNISWETGEAPVIVLENGSIHWDQEQKSEYNVVLKSALFEFIAPLGNFILTMDMQQARTEIKVIKGSIEFFAMNGEQTVQVQGNQKASFQGILEGNDIAYDVLLKGKKIPRGKLSDVQSFTKEEAQLYSVESQEKLKALAAQIEAKEKARLAKLKEGIICYNPEAKMNQCAWTCKGNPAKEKRQCRLDLKSVSCIRTRCNANGKWADETILSKDKGLLQCKPFVSVRKCDY